MEVSPRLETAEAPVRLPDLGVDLVQVLPQLVAGLLDLLLQFLSRRGDLCLQLVARSVHRSPQAVQVRQASREQRDEHNLYDGDEDLEVLDRHAAPDHANSAPHRTSARR